MMTFIIMTLSFTVAIILSAVLSFIVMNYVFKMVSRMEQIVDDQENNGL